MGKAAPRKVDSLGASPAEVGDGLGLRAVAGLLYGLRSPALLARQGDLPGAGAAGAG